MSGLFDIVTKQQSSCKNSHSSQKNCNQNYIKLQGDFLARHLGLYTMHFIEMIAQDAASICSELAVMSIHKILKDITKRFMLTDLQLVNVGHISNLLGWNIKQAFIRRKSEEMRYDWESVHRETCQLYFFLNLVSSFVKKYIGEAQQCKAIDQMLRKQSCDRWQGIYQQWLETCPSQIFKLSPRAVNEIYSRYTRNCQSTTQPKNYNKMVDQIMELSTSYSMIPGTETKQSKKKKSIFPSSDLESNNQELHSFGRKIIKVNQLPQGPSNYFKLRNQSSMEAPLEANIESRRQKDRKYRLGLNKQKETRINNNVTEFFKDKSSISVCKRFTPHSTIGFPDPAPGGNFFDSKLFSSGEEIIPYTLRSNSNIFKSKWLE